MLLYNALAEGWGGTIYTEKKTVQNLKKKSAKKKINFNNGQTDLKNGYSNKESYYYGKLNQWW